jgi:hypothetical protein
MRVHQPSIILRGDKTTQQIQIDLTIVTKAVLIRMKCLKIDPKQNPGTIIIFYNFFQDSTSTCGQLKV